MLESSPQTELANQPTEAQKLSEELSDLMLPLMWTLRQDAVRAFESLGIRPVRALLLELVERGFQHPKDLSDMLDTVPPTISAMVAELEERGVIQRHIDPADRRRVRLSLTEEGQVLRHKMRERWLETSRERLAKLSSHELKTLLSIYKKLLEVA